MHSQWSELKAAATELRKVGMSLREIESKLGIPRSTLSGWLRSVSLSPEQSHSLALRKQEGLKKARNQAVLAHKAAKLERVRAAKIEADESLRNLTITTSTLDIALALLYMGEGSKNGTMSIASSDPRILQFYIATLGLNYDITPDKMRCELHLRVDQKPEEIKKYWSEILGISLCKFGYVAQDIRSKGKKTYEHYKGVCVVYGGSIAIRRKIMYLYTEFCEQIITQHRGA